MIRLSLKGNTYMNQLDNVIIGSTKNGILRTNFPTSEKFNCDAYEDREAKKKAEHDAFIKELERISYDV